MKSFINTTHPRTARETIKNPTGILELQFLRTSRQWIQTAISDDLAEIDSIKQELSLMEPSSLRIHHSDDTWYFGAFSQSSKNETGITNDLARIHLLARRAYLQERMKSMERDTRRFQKILDTADQAAYELKLRKKFDRYAKAGLDLYRIIYTQEQVEWIDEMYSPNPYFQNNLSCRTNQGTPVRSKSESIFGSFLESLGLPFRSDDLVRIHADAFGDRPFKESYFADFKIPNLCGGITIHEHLGAFHRQDYAENALKRLNDYHNFTLQELPNRPVMHDEITWSFESDLHDERRMYQLIRRILLPSRIGS